MVSDPNSSDNGTEPLQRRLATILAADVVGHSRDIEGRWDNGARFQGHWEMQPP